MSRKKLSLLAFPAAIAAVIALSACSPMSGGTTEETTAPPMSEETTAAPSMDPAADLVGSCCAAYADAVPDGAGSVAGMALDPVATAASNNPLLTTLVKAVSGQLNPNVDLVNTLNNGEFTVFAPVDAAFAKLPADTVTTLGTDADLLTKILTYHVVAGQIAPDAIVGTHTTVEGQDLEVAGFEIREGDLVAASPAVSNGLDFPDADAFDPQRYLDPRFEDTKNPWTWIPFGGGKHRCVGAAFAQMQIKAIFSVLLREYEFEMSQPSETYRNDHSKMVVQLAQPAKVRYRRRQTGGPEHSDRGIEKA